MSTTEPDLSTMFGTDDNDGGELPDNDFTGETTPREIPGLDRETFPGEKTPRSHERRTPLAELATFAWGGIGMGLVQTGADVPVGRVMQFQAPLAGKKFDELIAGTWLDSILQPFAKQADKIEGLGAIVMFPLLVGAYERQPELEPIIAPILRQVVSSTLADMAPVLKKQQADRVKAANAIADLSDLFPEMEKGQNPIDLILHSIFAPTETIQQGDEPNHAE